MKRIEDIVEEALQTLQGTGVAEVTEMYAVSNSMTECQKIIDNRNRVGDIFAHTW